MAKGKGGSHNGATVSYQKGMCSPSKKPMANVHSGSSATYAGASGKKQGKHVK